LAVRGLPSLFLEAFVGGGLAGVAAAAVAVPLRIGTLWESWRLSGSGIRYVRNGLLGRQEWDEPMENYSGVVLLERESFGKAVLPELYGSTFCLILRHRARQRRSVKLRSSPTPEVCWLEHRRYARLLGVPMIVATAPTSLPTQPSREPASLSGSRPAATGRRGRCVGEAATGLRSAVDVHEGTVIVKANAWRLSLGLRVFAVEALALGQAFYLEWFTLASWRWSAFAVGGMVTVAVGVTSLVMHRCWEELQVSPEGISTSWHHPLGQSRGGSLPLREVLDVFMSCPGAARATSLWVVGKGGFLRFGRGLKVRQLWWVEGILKAALDAHPPPASAAG
jgi:hypothetical protein